MMSKNAQQQPLNKEVLAKVEEVYPGAFTNETLTKKVQHSLDAYGYGESTILATSLCSDEVNRELEKGLNQLYGDNFCMGGLAGFSFCGKTSFGAMASHIPDGGSCLIVYGPHVGIDANCDVGVVDRRGRAVSNSCCGSAKAACAYVKNVKAGLAEIAEPPEEPDDAQQYWVGSRLLPYADRLAAAECEEAELPLALFDSQDKLMKKIVSSMCGTVAGDGKIALLGGVQINTPPGTPDLFLPKVFVLKNNKGEVVADLLHTLK
jgi:hypothetical protein